MKTSFTPGPWTQGGLDKNDKHWKRSVNADRNSVSWCGSGDDVTAHANARLIAAAPCLLEALINLLAVHEGQGGTKFHAGNIARAAIDKATGSLN